MKKLIFFILILLIATPIFSETFYIYGVSSEYTEKYSRLFDMPKFSYMGGALTGDYVYQITLISEDEKYYCVGIITDNWFDKVVMNNGRIDLEISESEYRVGKFVSLSYRPVILIFNPWNKTEEAE
jgi:hypothetical protein